uniref:Selenoprotein T n=1 Tax=Scleropages formosus TaxID=113540 RepID=A0A8C9S2H7_SCLFO
MERFRWPRFSACLLFVGLPLIGLLLACGASADSGGVKRLKMQFATGPLLKFQIWWVAAGGYRRVFEEYTRVLNQRYPDIRIEGENYLPLPVYRYIASFLSIFKFAVIGLIILGKDPFGFFGMQAPGLWVWGQENKIYACMMVFFLSNMIENQCMSTGAFEITFNDVPVWSKLQSGHLPSMQQLVQILDNEMKMNVHMDALPHQRS